MISAKFVPTDGFAANYGVSAFPSSSYQGSNDGNVWYAQVTTASGMNAGRGAALSAQSAGCFIEWSAEL